MDQQNNPRRIAIVGAGTAGLVAALILKTRFPDRQIDIICSKKIGIIGVGEGSTEHWLDFARYVGLETSEMIKKSDATFKIGIVFKGWGVPDYMHSIQDGYNLVVNRQYPYIYSNLISKDVHSKKLSGSAFWDNKINTWFLKNNEAPVAQYHFNTFSLNKYLTEVAEERGVRIITDEIQDVTINDNGIDELVGLESRYKYDFYIDSTGFRKALITKLGGKWVSHKQYLKTNSAIVFPTEDTENYNMWSLAQAMDYGWLFRTPVWGRWGNGYIYDDEFLTPEQAQEEVEKFLGHKIKVANHIKFDPGALEEAWIKNCCALGLSSSFVEPLEASSIGATIQQTFMLIHRLVNYNQDAIDKYNKAFRDLIENIRDFIVLHFICPRRDTAFWRKVADIKLPDTLEKNLKVWRNKLPIEEDFTGITRYILFKELHFLMIVHGLKLFDVEKIKEEFESLPDHVKADAERVVEGLMSFNDEQKVETVTHKQMLEIIRNSV